MSLPGRSCCGPAEGEAAACPRKGSGRPTASSQPPSWPSGLLLLVQGLGLGFDPSVSLPLVLVGLGLLVTWHRFGVETLITGRTRLRGSRWASFSPVSESRG